MISHLYTNIITPLRDNFEAASLWVTTIKQCTWRMQHYYFIEYGFVLIRHIIMPCTKPLHHQFVVFIFIHNAQFTEKPFHKSPELHLCLG